MQMQTPKTRKSCSESGRKISPRSVSSDATQRGSGRTVRQLKTTGLEPISSFNTTPISISPKVIDRRSPRSPVSELQKKRQGRVFELETQITQLQDALKTVKDQLISSESWKVQAKQDAEESRKQILAMSLKLEESQNLVTVTESEATQTKQAESEIHALKENMAETLSFMAEMKKQLQDSKVSESKAHALATETLLQLETAKKTIESIKLDGKSVEEYNAIAMELEKSRAQVSSLEKMVENMKNSALETEKSYAEEIIALKSEVGQLKSPESRQKMEVMSAYELVEQLKSNTRVNEAELKKSKAEIEELKANLMDKETELQGICEENEDLNSKLQSSLLGTREIELENDLNRSTEDFNSLKSKLTNLEAELRNTLDENERLKSEIKKLDCKEEGKVDNLMEEIKKSNEKVASLTEQLEATAQTGNSETEAELRRLKVQSDQWRKAAEAAAAMLNGGKTVERTWSMENYSPRTRTKIGARYVEEIDEDDEFLKKKNGSMLKRIGVLWKRPHNK